MSTVKSIKELVGEKISAAGANVAEIVANELANTEIQRRKGLIMEGMATLDKLRKEFAKLKPDASTFSFDSGNNKVENVAWSKSALEAKEKLEQKVDKLAKAIDNALDKNDADSYNKLVEASK